MEQETGVHQGGTNRGATPEQRAIHLRSVWLEKEIERRATPRDEQVQRAEWKARCNMFDAEIQLQRRSSKPD